MHVTHLGLADFRSYPSIDVDLEPGVTAFIGANGQGKTNLVEAIDYAATLESHRASSDVPLIRAGAEQAVIRLDVTRGERQAKVDIEIGSRRANRARINGSILPRTRDVIGVLRTVMFSPEDLTLVKGDPSDRRRFIDTLLTMRTPRLAGVRSDYDRVIKQRNALLKSARGRTQHVDLSTLDVWDEKLATLGAELITQRLTNLTRLDPHLTTAYQEVASSSASDRQIVTASYRSSIELGDATDETAIRSALLTGIETRRSDELQRGVSLVGPHRDEIELAIGNLPARGYASHGESWSLALALRLASFRLLNDDGDDPILILDDVFAELDERRRDHLASLVGGVEQLFITAAVAEDVPQGLSGRRFTVAAGEVARV